MDIIELRHTFHRIAETQFEEIKTTKKIIEFTEDFGYDMYYGKSIYKEFEGQDSKFEDIDKGYTGVLLKKGEPPYTLIRADIDALPVKESDKTKAALEGWKSINASNMHACGHDGHIALGIKLAEFYSKIDKGIKILFQPAEENVGGGIRMADFICKDVKKFVGFHIGLGQKSGTIGVGSTEFYAVRKIAMTFYGKGAHVANNPEKGKSALSMAIAFINMSRDLLNDKRGRKILNIGTIRGGNAINIIMDEVELGLDARALRDDLVDQMIDDVKKIAEGVASALGGSYSYKELARANAYMEDDDAYVEKIAHELERDGFKTELKPEFGASEDVTIYMNRVKENGGKAIHLLLGTELAGPHHSSEFDFEEDRLDEFFRAIRIVVDEK